MSSLTEILSAMRKGDRLAVALPVKVLVTENATTAEWSCTYEVSRTGIRLKQVSSLKVGQEIWVQRQRRRAMYRVVWMGQPETVQAGQMGVECMDERVIWEDEIQGRLL